jgi:hypothetical protein
MSDHLTIAGGITPEQESSTPPSRLRLVMFVIHRFIHMTGVFTVPKTNGVI